MKASVLVLIWLMAISTDAQKYGVSEDTVPVIGLRALITHPVPVPAFRFQSNQCDSVGNVFFDVTGDYYKVKTFVKMSIDGTIAQPFLPPPSVLGKSSEWHYSVDQEGGLYILYSRVEDHVLVHLSASGKKLSDKTLQLPRYFHPNSFAVLPDQRALIDGYVPTSETTAKPLSIYLDSNGSPVRTLHGRSEISIMDNRDGLVVAEGTTSFIELFGETLTNFDPQGNVLWAYSLTKPSKYAFATNLQFVNGFVAITYAHRINAPTDMANNPSTVPWSRSGLR